MKLTGKQIHSLTGALTDAFPSLQKLEQFLLFYLDKRINLIISTGNLYHATFEVIICAQSEGWLKDLVEAARESNPGNIQLYDFCSDVGYLGIPSKDLERLIRPHNKFIQISNWCEKIHQLEKQICRIEYPTEAGDTIFGTGFLISQRHVMTNFHVIEPAYNRWIQKKEAPDKANFEDIKLRFDFRTNASETTVLNLDKDWLSCFSGYDGGDKDENLGNLDYAVLKLNEVVATERGYIDIKSHLSRPKTGDSLVILQHPEGQPLRMAIDTNGVVKIIEDTFLEYSTNTLGGSSGSPCFNLDLDIVAVHHTGDNCNIGTLLNVVMRDMQYKGFSGFF